MWTVPPMSKMMVEILTSQFSTECCLNQYESKRSNVGLCPDEFVENPLVFGCAAWPFTFLLLRLVAMLNLLVN